MARTRTVNWAFAAAFAASVAFCDETGVLYDANNVCLANGGVSLMPCGEKSALLPPSAAQWKTCNYENRLALRFDTGENDGAFFVCGPTNKCNTAWTVRSPRTPLPHGGTEYLVKFSIDASFDMKISEPISYKWSSGIHWYDASGNCIASDPLHFRVSAPVCRQLRGSLPAGAAAFELQFGCDVPNVPPGGIITLRDISVSVCGNSPRCERRGHFTSEFRAGGRITWRAKTAPGQSVKFQYASADDLDALGKAAFRGPDGTGRTFYTEPFDVAGRWIRYRVFMESADGTSSPVLESVRIGNAVESFWTLDRDTTPPHVAVVSATPTKDATAPLALRITDAAIVNAKSFRAVVDGVDLTASFAHGGDTFRLAAPGGAWSNGLHRIDVTVADCHGNMLKTPRFLFVGDTPTTPRVTLRDDGCVLVDGEPFFPIGAYSVCRREFNGNSLERAFEDLGKVGFNFAHTYFDSYDPEFLDAANKYGFKLWVWARLPDRKFIEIGRNTPSILAWYLADDTSFNTTPEELCAYDLSVKSVDPTRITCQADPIGHPDSSRYADYVNYADVFMPEIYPVRKELGDKSDTTCVAETIRDMETFARDVRERGNGKPRSCWPIIQYFQGWSDWRHFPTRQQLYAMTWAAVVHGANGMTWYTYGGFPSKDGKSANYGITSTPERWANICELATRLKELSPALVSRKPSDQPKVAVVSGVKTDPFGQSSVSCLLKRTGGSSYLIAVNASPEPVTARFAVKGQGEAKVMWENRTVNIGQDGITDYFAPFAVHVYNF